MKYTKVHTLFFSPTHTSRIVAESVVKGLNAPRTDETNLTFECPRKTITIEDSLAVIAVPVYGGRVAETAMERVGKNKGEAGACDIDCRIW